ncbi:hypothetical protein JCM39194_00010 [Desulfotomaculum varum]
MRKKTLYAIFCVILLLTLSSKAFAATEAQLTEAKKILPENDLRRAGYYYDCNIDKELSDAIDLLPQIIKPSMNKDQQIRAITEWVMGKYEYNIDYYERKKKAKEKGEPFKEEISEIYPGLKEGKAVCSGYTFAMNLLLSAAGIENRYVDAENHAWNLVKLRGNWYHVDATAWDTNKRTKNRYMLTDEQVLGDPFYQVQNYPKYKDMYKYPDCSQEYVYSSEVDKPEIRRIKVEVINPSNKTKVVESTYGGYIDLQSDRRVTEFKIIGVAFEGGNIIERDITNEVAIKVVRQGTVIMEPGKISLKEGVNLGYSRYMITYENPYGDIVSKEICLTVDAKTDDGEQNDTGILDKIKVNKTSVTLKAGESYEVKVQAYIKKKGNKKPVIEDVSDKVKITVKNSKYADYIGIEGNVITVVEDAPKFKTDLDIWYNGKKCKMTIMVKK